MGRAQKDVRRGEKGSKKSGAVKPPMGKKKGGASDEEKGEKY